VINLKTAKAHLIGAGEQCRRTRGRASLLLLR
jgi:hypothetical protein